MAFLLWLFTWPQRSWQSVYCIAEEEEASCAGRHGKRKALKAFLHKLRHAPAAHAAATTDTIPASAAPPGMPILLYLDCFLVTCFSLHLTLHLCQLLASRFSLASRLLTLCFQ